MLRISYRWGIKRMGRRVKFITLLAFLAIALWAEAGITNASGGWTPESVLFEAQDGAMDIGLSLVSDEFGYAHLAWFNAIDDEVGAFYYSRWDGQVWTAPVDILVVDSGWPVLVSSRSGKLHIFWNTGSDLYHTWSWATGAHSPHAWSKPEIVVHCEAGCSVPIDAKEDRQGYLHVVYSLREGDCYYIYSEDEGATWSNPNSVSSVASRVATFVPSLAISENGRVHVVWAEVGLPESTWLRLNYAHSSDKGLTWTFPLELGAGNHSDGTILAIGDNEVHLAWNGGIGIGGRYYQYSADGGVTWSIPARVFEAAGRAGYPSLAFDGAGTLHILTGQGEYAWWTGSTWTDPLALTTLGDRGEQARMTIVRGSQILAVWPSDFSGIHFRVCNLDILPIPTVAPPDPAPEQILNPTAPTDLATVAPTPQGIKDHSEDWSHMAAPSQSTIGSTLAISIGMALLVVVVVVASTRLLKKR
jgi:hypothetical protein